MRTNIVGVVIPSCFQEVGKSLLVVTLKLRLKSVKVDWRCLFVDAAVLVAVTVSVSSPELLQAWGQSRSLERVRNSNLPDSLSNGQVDRA